MFMLINYGLCRRPNEMNGKEKNEILMLQNIKSCEMIHKFPLFNYWSFSMISYKCTSQS